MASVKRAVVWASFARYSNIAINLGTTMIVARTLSPTSYGISVMCASVMSLAEALREFGGGAYLIQQRDLTAQKIRTSFTVNLIVTCISSLVILAVSGIISKFFHLPQMNKFLRVSIIAYLCGPLIYPFLALFSRNMQFSRIYVITLSMTILRSIVTVQFSLIGFEYMSFAWANVAAAILGVCLCLYLSPRDNLHRPCLADWRAVTTFGAFDCLTALAAAFAEYAPYLAIGRSLPTFEVAIAQRAIALGFIPERILLAGVGAVALPEFSRRARENDGLQRAYLDTIEYSTAVYWPALVGLALLADPMVKLLYGPAWREAAAILPVICAAFCFGFPASLQYPVLVSAGAVRVLPGLVAVQGAITFSAIALTAPFGLAAAAASLLLSAPANVFIGALAIRSKIGMTWLSLAARLRKSAIVTLFTACGPLTVMALSGVGTALSIRQAAVAIALGGVFWAAGLLLTGHPLAKELRRAF